VDAAPVPRCAVLNGDRWFRNFRLAIDSTIHTNATAIVILVNKSPAFVPKALAPPMPPKAPVSPPPRPRCTRMTRIKKTEINPRGIMNR
jgi:hypothetical protein